MVAALCANSSGDRLLALSWELCLSLSLLGDLMAVSAFISVHSRLKVIFLFVSGAYLYGRSPLGVSFPHLSSCSSRKPN